MRSLSERLAGIGDAARLHRLQLGVALFGVLVMLAYAGASGYDSWRSHRYALIATHRELDNTAAALAEQTAWTLQAVDVLLLDTVQWYHSEGYRLSPKAIEAVLAARNAGVAPVRQVTIVDANGQPLYGSRPLPLHPFSVSTRSYFVAQRDDPAGGLLVSDPLVTRTTGITVVVLSRRIEDSQHHFAGVITASVDLDHLKQLYQAVDIQDGTAIQLLQDDGTLLVRNPLNVDAIGRRFAALVTLPSTPFPQFSNPLDGHKDFIAIAPIRNTHLKLAVTRDASVALQPWRDETIRLAVRTLILTLIATVTIAVLLRQFRRVATGEQALRQSEQRYALAMEGANEGHWDWDISSDQLFLSPRMKVLSGLATQSDVTSPAAWLSRIEMPPEDRSLFEGRLAEHFQGLTGRFECEYRVRQRDGNWHWLLARGRCLLDGCGRPQRFVGSAVDISAQKQALIEKERLEKQLRQSQKMEAIGTLSGGIAHDFNNILGSILGYAELALERVPESGTLHRYLNNVMHATERAKMLVQRILGFSRSGLRDKVRFNVQSVVAETLELLEGSLPVGIQLRKQLAAGAVAVIGDPTDLHQVTMNLCTNAIQAMEPAGVLDVTLERCEASQRRTLAQGVLVPGSYVRLTVSDTGRGIPPEILERIFDPFFTTKGVGEGTGLGLSLVHGIVSDLGGAIDVASKVGDGTRFDIWLPVAGEVAMPALEPFRAVPLGRGQVVMVVDDEQALVGLAEESIARLGYEPVGFDSSLAALQAFRAAPNRFDLVLTDESMPDLVGTELAKEIRSLRPSVPIILMTGFGGVQLASRGADVGVNEILRKPLRSRDLAESLARALA
jgi:PAS domain S-box-containing protein